MAALSWGTAWRVASRELRSSRGKFLFVVLSVAIGVAALTGVRGFAAAFRETLSVRARSILAADLSARMFQQPNAKEQQALLAIATEGVVITPVTEMAGMAVQKGHFDPLLVALKAVDPTRYPFYGSVELQPNIPLQLALQNHGVAVGEDLLIRLGLKVGDQIQLGNQALTIRAVVTSEPDRLSGSFAAGPRVLMSLPDLDATGLVAPGSRAGQRYLLHLSNPSDAMIERLKHRVEEALPEAQITDYRETNVAITTALDRSTELLSLISLVALVLGAAGVAMAMRTHLLQRMDGIAIMKSLGAQTTHILRIYLLETLLLGVAGGAVGILLGIFVQLALPLLLAKLLGITPDLHLSIGSIATGLGTGIVMTLLFTLPPLLDIRTVRPIAILRRNMEDPPMPWRQRLQLRIRKAPMQLLGAIVILLGVALIATFLSGSRSIGIVFTLGITIVLLVLMVVATLLLRVLRAFLQRTRLALPPTLRHGLANLYRPGNPSAVLLATLGVGIMLLLSVYFVQKAFVSDLNMVTRAGLPNVFLIDISPDEVAPLSSLLKQQPSVQGSPEMLPVVSARIASVNGVAAENLHLKNYPQRALRSTQLSWSDHQPVGTSLERGIFWKTGETGPLLAVEQHRAERLGVHIGSRIVFAVGDRTVDATVVALTKSDGQHIYSRADFILPPNALQNVPVVWYGGVHVIPERVGELQRVLFSRYPTVTVINVAQAFETMRNVLTQISLVIQFLAGFSMFAGLIILAAAIAGTRYRRVREVVVLKTLGGTRNHIAAIFSIEFAMLGVVAGCVGVIAANLVARSALHSMKLTWTFHPVISVSAIGLAAALVVVAGWTASYRVLGQKPLEVLREE